MSDSEFSGLSQARPGASAAVLRTFMQFPSPAVVLSSAGALLLANDAWSAGFGTASVVADSLHGLPRGEGEQTIAVRAADSDAVSQVPAWAVVMPGRTLLVVRDAAPLHWHAEADQLRRRVAELEQLVATDHLTGAWNRAHFDRLIQAELARSLEWQRPVSLVLLDIDHFKHVNDRHGHGVGDSVLRELVRLVQARLRASDVLFRWGGEEFAVLVAAAGYRGAERVADDLCRAVAAHTFRGAGALTISLGVAEHLGGEDSETWFHRLDAALYAAKEGGRNRVVVDRRGNSDTWAAAAAPAALQLTWLEAYECGEATIDREHIELFARANELIDAASRVPGDADAVRNAFDGLLAHVQQHFADEEVILERHQYADLEMHRRAHAGLLRRAAHLKQQADAGRANLGTVVEFLVQDVVARHMMGVDRAFYHLFVKGRAVPSQ